MVRFSCPTCGQHFAGDESYYGRQLNCPACRNNFTVTAPATASAAVPPPIPSQVPRPTGAHAAPGVAGHLPPNQLPPRKSNTAVKAILGVLAFLLSAAVSFVVVTRVLGSHGEGEVKAESTTAKKTSSASKAKNSTPTKAAAVADNLTLEPSDLIQRVNDAYGALTSYSAEGTVVTDMDMSKMDLSSIPGLPPQVAAQAKGSKEAQAAMAKPQHMEAEFSVKLSKPGLYRIDWKMQQGPMKTTGAAWSAGDGDYLFMGIKPPKYVKMQSRDLALGAAGGVSQGAANTVPVMFFKGKSMLSSLENTTLGNAENLDGTDCYVLNGDLRGMKVNVWVDKSTFLIKQKQQVLGGDFKMPEMSDKDLDAAVKQMGGPVTPEKRAQVKAMMQNMRAVSSKIKGTITETYRSIETNGKISADKFKYEVPAGVQLSTSLF